MQTEIGARRFADVIVAACGLVLLSPLLIAIVVVLRWTGERRVMFTQQRIGLNGQPFNLCKFVTMRAATVDTGLVTTRDDPNVLAVGRLLRLMKVNEIPQLWNVLRGDMALVGPRPLSAVSFDCYPADIRPVLRSMKPGLTGLGSLFFHAEEDVLAALGKDNRSCYHEDIMPLKGALEVWYRDHRSSWVDAEDRGGHARLARGPSGALLRHLVCREAGTSRLVTAHLLPLVIDGLVDHGASDPPAKRSVKAATISRCWGSLNVTDEGRHTIDAKQASSWPSPKYGAAAYGAW